MSYKILLSLLISIDILFAYSVDQAVKDFKKNSIEKNHFLKEIEYKKVNVEKEKVKIGFYPALNLGLRRMDGATSINLGFTEKIFDSGAAKYSVKSSITEKLDSELDFEEFEYKKKLEIYELYLSVLFHRENIRIFNVVKRKVRKAYNKIKKGRKLNYFSIADFQYIQAQFEDSEFRVKREEGSLAVVMRKLRFMTKKKNLSAREFVTPKYEDVQLNDYKKLIKKVFNNKKHPILKKLSISLKKSYYDYRVEQASYNPSSSISLGGQYFKSELSSSKDWKASWTVGVGVFYPLLASKPKRISKKAYSLSTESKKIYNNHLLYNLSLRLLTKLQEKDIMNGLLVNLRSRIRDSYKKWKERDRLFFNSSIMSVNNYGALVEVEAQMLSEEVKTKFEVQLRNVEILHLLREI